MLVQSRTAIAAQADIFFIVDGGSNSNRSSGSSAMNMEYERDTIQYGMIDTVVVLVLLDEMSVSSPHLLARIVLIPL